MSDTSTTDLTNYNPETGEVTDDTTVDPGALVIQETIRDLQDGRSNVFSTVVGDDFASKVTVLNAVTTAEPIKKNLDKHIDLVNIVVQQVEVSVTDPRTKETTKQVQPRVILLDRDGSAYYGTSVPMLKAVQTFIGILGQPHTWPETGVGMKVVQGTSRNGFDFYNMLMDLQGPTPIPVNVGGKK